MTDQEPHLSKTEARAGTTPRMTRPILTLSLLLIIGIFVLLYFFWSN